MGAIEVSDLTKSYGAVRALDGVTFSVSAGETVAILGPNGAGKTTLVEILEGFRERSAGDVRVLGTDPADDAPGLRERVGVVLQSTAVEPFLTVREVLDLFGHYYSRSLGTDEVLRLVGLEDQAGRRIRTLSGGQQRRVDLALGLVGDPELLFLDEPTTGFDPQARRDTWDLLRGFTAGGRTVVLTTHYLDEVVALADRVLIVSTGRILFDGPLSSVGDLADRPTVISFVPPAGCRIDAVPLPTTVERGRWTIRSNDPTPDLHALTTWALGAPAALVDLTVVRPTLEDVYLEVVE